jgi:uncharacterized oxidoreductase
MVSVRPANRAFITTIFLLFHPLTRACRATGKDVIITGRRSDRLASLRADLGSKVASYEWDITDFAGLAARADGILKNHPEIDAVFLVAGVGSMFSFLDAATSTDESVITECNTNLTAQILLSRSFVPFLSSRASEGHPSAFMLMGSGLGFMPNGLFPIYCPTKSALHSLALCLRQEVNTSKDENVKKNLSIVEIVAPYVDTALMAAYDLSMGPKPMPLEEYMDETMKVLGGVDEDGKAIKEAAVGTAKPRLDLWRGSIGKHMNEIGMKC